MLAKNICKTSWMGSCPARKLYLFSRTHEDAWQPKARWEAWPGKLDRKLIPGNQPRRTTPGRTTRRLTFSPSASRQSKAASTLYSRPR